MKLQSDNFSHLLRTLFIAAALPGFFVACNDSTGTGRSATKSKNKAIQQRIIYAVGNEEKFSADTIRVEPDQKVNLQLINHATLPVMEHNFVLVLPGSAQEVALAGLDAGPGENYVSPVDTNVVAATPVAAPGDTVSVAFNPPEPGFYDFICTFPGHYERMHGIFIVNGDTTRIVKKKEPESVDPGSPESK